MNYDAGFSLKLPSELKDKFLEYIKLIGISPSEWFREKIEEEMEEPDKLTSKAKEHASIAKSLKKRAKEARKMQEKRQEFIKEQQEKEQFLCSFCGKEGNIIPVANDKGEAKRSCVFCIETAELQGFKRKRGNEVLPT